jgi:hypothetical protein
LRLCGEGGFNKNNKNNKYKYKYIYINLFRGGGLGGGMRWMDGRRDEVRDGDKG